MFTNEKRIIICFEGVEASGKTTQIKRIKEVITDSLECGNCTVSDFSPFDTDLGSAIKNLIPKSQDSITDLFLYGAAIADLTEKVLVPEMKNVRHGHNKIIFLDRFADSMMVYQHYVYGLPYRDVGYVANVASRCEAPHLTIWLDIPPKESLARLSKRKVKDKHESQPLAFHQRIAEGYKAIWQNNKQRIVRIDGTLPADDVTQAILKAISKKFNLPFRN